MPTIRSGASSGSAVQAFSGSSARTCSSYLTIALLILASYLDRKLLHFHQPSRACALVFGSATLLQPSTFLQCHQNSQQSCLRRAGLFQATLNKRQTRHSTNENPYTPGRKSIDGFVPTVISQVQTTTQTTVHHTAGPYRCGK